MKRFSERQGITKPQPIQLNGINEALRNSLWNVILIYSKAFYRTEDGLKGLCNRLAIFFFKIPVDSIRGLYYTPDIEDWIKRKFYGLEWYQAYEFIEFLVQNEICFKEEDFQKTLNAVLKRKIQVIAV